MKSTKVIYVNPVERTSAQGRHKQVYTIQGVGMPTVSMKKVKEDNTPSLYEFPSNPQTNKLQTGLDTLIGNPFYKLDPSVVMTEYKLNQKWVDIIPKVVSQDQILEQTYLEIKHGVDPDYYTDSMGYTMINMPTDMRDWGKKTYLQSLKLTLYPRPNKFDDSTPRQELLMKMVEQVSDIAKNKTEANPAYHNWYISQQNEAEQEVAKKNEIIEEAMYHLHKLKKDFGKFRTYQVGIVLRDFASKPILKGKVTSETVNNILSGYIGNKDKYQFRNINEFTKIIHLFDTREGLEKLDIMYLIQQALNTNVFAFRDNQFIWHSKAGTPDVYMLGSSYDKLVSFFFKEYQNHNEEGLVTNWYKDLLDEVSQKGIEFE